MNRLLFKFGLFLCLCMEIAAELHISGDMALLLSLAAWFGGRFAVRLALQALGLFGPTVFGLLAQAALWLALFWWFAPPWLWAQPWGFVLGGAGLLVLAGAFARRIFAREWRRHGHALWRVHSTAVVAALLAAVAAGALATVLWHSLWPLVGYGLLLYLPLGVGWRLMPILREAQANARMGEADDFRNAGFSDER